MEPVNPPKGWLEDPRTQEDCETCDKANCNDRGFIPGGDDLPEDVCCSCEKCHGDPIKYEVGGGMGAVRSDERGARWCCLIPSA